MTLRGTAVWLVAFMLSWRALHAGQGSETGSPRQAAADLARRGVPGGIVARERDLDGAKSPYQAHTVGPFVHIRSSQEPERVALSLGRDVYIERDLVLPAQDAVFTHVVRAIAGREPQGILGSGRFPGPECPLTRPVQLPQGGSTVVGFLDEITRQVPGLVWLVTYDEDEPNDGLTVGFVCADGATVKLSVFP